MIRKTHSNYCNHFSKAEDAHHRLIKAEIFNKEATRLRYFQAAKYTGVTQKVLCMQNIHWVLKLPQSIKYLINDVLDW